MRHFSGDKVRREDMWIEGLADMHRLHVWDADESEIEYPIIEGIPEREMTDKQEEKRVNHWDDRMEARLEHSHEHDSTEQADEEK